MRPFWGRVFALSGGSLVALYLIGTIGIFGVFRTIGYPVSYANIAWPPAWKKLDEMKSDFFFVKFQAAYAAHDVPTGLLDLSLAHQLNPKNYDITLLLAQLYKVGQPGLSNTLFNRLITDDPGQAEKTAQAFFIALLARGDFASIQTLAGSRLFAPGSTSTAWLNAFLFADTQTGDTKTFTALTADPRVRQLPSNLQAVLTLAAQLRTASPDNAANFLLAAANGANGYTLYYICEQLTRHGFPDATLRLLDQPGSGLNDRDHVALLLDALALKNWSIVLNAQFDSLLAAPPTPAVVELLCTHLINYPDPDLLGKLFQKIQQSPLPPGPDSYTSYLALFFAGGVANNQACIDWATARLNEILGFNFAQLGSARDFLTGRQKLGHLGNFLPSLQPLPLETMYALFNHYSPPVLPVPQNRPAAP